MCEAACGLLAYSMADYWLPTWPGSEAAVLLAMARILLVERLYNRDYLRRWVNWQEYLAQEHAGEAQTFAHFIDVLIEQYAVYTPAFAAAESGVSEESIIDIARQIGRAGTRFAAHTWRAATAGNLGGWQVARAPTMQEWGWPEYVIPCYIRSHVHRAHINHERGEYLLIPTFRLPTLIHTRSGNVKWLYEISNANPVWIHPIVRVTVMMAVSGSPLAVAAYVKWLTFPNAASFS